MEKASFSGIFIPREIVIDQYLTPNCKLLYGFIQSLDGSEEGCWAHNSYFAGLLSLSEESVRASLYILEKRGYITRKKSKDGIRTIKTTSTKHLSKLSSAPWKSDGKETNAPENLGGDTEKSGGGTENLGGRGTGKSVSALYSDSNTNDSNTNNTIIPTTVEELVDFSSMSKEFKEVWKEFKVFRNKMKRPMTPYAEKLMARRFKGVEEKKLIKAIQLSIERSWLGVFPDAVEYANGKTNMKNLLTDNDHIAF